MRMLTFDIETRPHTGAVWGKWEQNVIWWESYGGIISIAWKWSDEKRTHVRGLPDYPGYKVGKEDDKPLLEEFCTLAEEADVFIYQNGDRFDLTTINARLIFHRMTPMRPRQTIDTLKIFRKYFKFPANNLDEVCEYLGIGRKVRTDKNLWKDCLNKSLDEKVRMRAWAYMKKYNSHDVELTEEVCKLVLPFATPQINGQVNKNVYEQTIVRCPNAMCGSTKLIKRGMRRTATGQRQAFQCQVCGRYASGPHESAHFRHYTLCLAVVYIFEGVAELRTELLERLAVKLEKPV